ncbi:MAG: imidazole glycerol phosphate synthase subunit HisH [Actinobacteria bacterium]|nr:imidazole glycerol phosphate synthase subunit HisH [Actinomycetota bacterium]
MKAGIVDYRMGNLASISKALEAVGARVTVSDAHAELADSDLLVLPGVGNFAAGMANINRLGLRAFIGDWAHSGKPLLGICLGMQLLFDSSEEGESDGLGVLKGRVVRLPAGMKVPHMGWNTVDVADHEAGPLKGLDGRSFYFVHSYVCSPDASIVSATTEYGMTFASAIRSGAITGFQFHPEKSSADGVELLRGTLMVAA